jgi:hypothetical protein
MSFHGQLSCVALLDETDDCFSSFSPDVRNGSEAHPTPNACYGWNSDIQRGCSLSPESRHDFSTEIVALRGRRSTSTPIINPSV